MTQVNISILNGGCVECHSNECVFKKDCAIHETAGEFREESGFTPEMKILSKSVANCHSFERPIFDGSSTYETLPDNVESLGCGLLFFKNGKLEPYNG